jgi:hypothetical protein
LYGVPWSSRSAPSSSPPAGRIPTTAPSGATRSCSSRGEIEVEAVGGERRRFRRGDVLALAGLPLRTLRTPGAADTVLVAVSRLERPADA